MPTTSTYVTSRSHEELMAEVERLCGEIHDRIIDAIVARRSDPPTEHEDLSKCDELRARAIGVLWSTGVHDAEDWVDTTIENLLWGRTNND